ncbi:ABC transporter ATP-binding protein [Prosthecomicrobium pneumaticum]|uniref:Multiple sugar transport system ATP-binding protein n=1 Tax=Prosthecomicrobium pneumaticum TaxID=81895 RepID=A0A7W9CVC1_9HYPH|nr:ABC transporter ATP-binding protein [Prosthecomicrobium pneumaticum]MBB5752570.1 multiple sugar transport system ATP-binding protein [Prosthecomicrobium pneumaticum]
MAEIAFRNVTKRFGDTVAVNDTSFTIADNEFFCFFGPPSSGKTTILRLILGLETPDSGEILIGGRPVTHTSPAERNVAMVFQNLALFPHMTARDNVRFPLVERKLPEAQIAARVAAVAEKLHIGHILHKPPAQLSGGERQRVAIARALVRDPAAYLMDDPISALDARLREETRVELKRIQRELGHTLLYVTHDQEEAMSVADRMAILERGAIRQIATPREIYERPASRYVAGLVGAPAINLLKGSADRAAGLYDLADGAIRLPLAAVPGEAVEVGVRPEAIRIAPFSGSSTKPATIWEVEPLGGFTVVTLSAGADRLRVMLRGQPRLTADEKVELSVDPAALHFFAADGTALAGRQ